MIAVGMLLTFFGYAIMYWGIQAIQSNNKQAPFIQYVIPFGR